MNDVQKRISIGQAINIAKDIVLHTSLGKENAQAIVDSIASLVPVVMSKLSVETFISDETDISKGSASILEALKSKVTKEDVLALRNQMLSSINGLSDDEKTIVREAFINHLKKLK